MRPKYYQAKFTERIRIPVQEREVLEMHRNARIDFYPIEIEEKIRADLSLSSLNRYPDVEKLYEGLAQFHQMDRQKLLITSGIDGGIKTVFEMCTKPDSKILVLAPTYGMYYAYSAAYETQMLTVTSDPQTLEISIEALLAAMNDEIDILFLPNPHEPIENVFELKALDRIMQKAQQHEILVFIDEAYYMFGAPTAIEMVDRYDNLIVARTFSKGLGLPAIRLGYLIANPALITYLESKRFAHEVNSLTIDIALWAMNNSEIFETYIDELCSSRDWLIERLHEMGLRTHGNKSNTILIDLQSSERADSVSALLYERDILVRGHLPDPVRQYILVTVGSREKTEQFFEQFTNIVERV